MSRGSDEHGPAYLRTYRSVDRLISQEQFVEVCVAQGLPAPSKRMFDHVRGMFRHREPNYLAMNDFDQRRKAARQGWTVGRAAALVAERHPETNRLEFKERIAGDPTTKKPWAAMANAGGGDVMYGIAEVDNVADRFEPVHFEGVEERFQQTNSQIDPPVTMSVERIALADDTAGVVCVRIAASVPGIVHLVDYRAPIRSGTTTRYMTSEEIRRWIREERRPPPTLF